ncbi:CoA-binding protein [Halobacillus litoralis]|uniref:CoA-binding protein n=1 Tax=Halobacillus litoralis TaxID=45668 RepID=A0A845DRY4_9BACI|nr:CoA-binding protein [Halobacillus litoralis]MCA1023177.1 CoA-binding protein [Halobacillus litoralis]MYL19305.1 CoA-binding protein [Halobacillus litoralis]MYL38119.1 CoA-binding protein [Halobacillus litoralis]
MPFENPSPEEIKNVLKESKTIAVVGLSDKPHRTSYQISEAMQAAGYRIIPVNPMVTEVLGEPAAASLREIQEPVDIVNVFRRSEYLPGVAEEAEALQPKAFWAQQGVYHEEAWEQLKDTSTKVMMDLCIKVAHSLYK